MCQERCDNMEVYKTYKFRMYPDLEQQMTLNSFLGSSRFIYNHYLNKKEENPSLTFLGMKKDLPNLYRGNISHGDSNNRQVSHGLRDSQSIRETIDKLFKENTIYRQNVEIVTKDKNLTTKIIGRTKDHVITINNIVIKIDDIESIKAL